MKREPIIPLELARLAKKKNFNWNTRFHYQLALTEKEDPDYGKSGPFGWEKGELSLQDDFHINNDPKFDYSNKNWGLYSAPTHAYLQKWLREEHGLVVLADIEEGVNGPWLVQIYGDYEKHKRFDLYTKAGFASYEEALEKGLRKALKLI